MSDSKKAFFEKIGLPYPDQRKDDPSIPPVDHELLLAYENNQLLPEDEADISWYLASSSKWREAQHKIFRDQSHNEESEKRVDITQTSFPSTKRHTRGWIALATAALVVISAILWLPGSSETIIDGTASLSVDRNGKVTGLDSFPAEYQKIVERLLSEPGLRQPEILAGTRGMQNNENSLLNAPTGTAVESLSPILRWKSYLQHKRYAVLISTDPNDPSPKRYDVEGNEWSPTEPLLAGKKYYWRLAVTENSSQPILFPPLEEPTAWFMTLSKVNRKKWFKVKSEHPNSKLIQLSVALDLGLLDVAEDLLSKLIVENPNSPILKRAGQQLNQYRGK